MSRCYDLFGFWIFPFPLNTLASSYRQSAFTFLSLALPFSSIIYLSGLFLLSSSFAFVCSIPLPIVSCWNLKLMGVLVDAERLASTARVDFADQWKLCLLLFIFLHPLSSPPPSSSNCSTPLCFLICSEIPVRLPHLCPLSASTDELLTPRPLPTDRPRTSPLSSQLKRAILRYTLASSLDL